MLTDFQLGNESTSMHFHGLFQNGTNDMDGPVGVTQCGIPPGSSFTYNFTIDQPGTYWYHSHSRGQYPDGLRGQFIVHDPDNPYRGQFDEEITVTLSDWYHDEMPGLLASFVSVTNPTGAEPVPDSALMNDTQNLTVHVQPGKVSLDFERFVEQRPSRWLSTCPVSLFSALISVRFVRYLLMTSLSLLRLTSSA